MLECALEAEWCACPEGARGRKSSNNTGKENRASRAYLRPDSKSKKIVQVLKSTVLACIRQISVWGCSLPLNYMIAVANARQQGLAVMLEKSSK
jgi:hypothetical protein